MTRSSLLHSPYVLSLLAGALLCASYRLPGFWPLSFIALIPLLFAVRRAKTLTRSVQVGMIPGFCIAGIATSWFFSVLPLPESFGVTNSAIGFCFVLISWFLVTLVMALPFGLWTGALHYMRFTKAHEVAAMAILFVAAEYLRMVCFNILTLAPGEHNPVFFSVGAIGYALADSGSWRQFASFGGIYFLSLVVVAVNLAFFCVLTARIGPVRNKILTGMIAALLFWSVVPLAAVRAHLAPPPTGIASVAIMSLWSAAPDFAGERASYRAQEYEFIRKSSNAGASLIILPEDTRGFQPFTVHTVGEYLAPGSAATVVDSGVFPLSPTIRTVRAFADTASSTTAVRDKQALTPQGEYLPMLFRLFLRVLGAQAQEEGFDTQHGLVTVSHVGTLVSAGPVRAGVLFCLEVLDPGLGSRLTQAGNGNLLAVPASHSWFVPSPSLERDIVRFSQIQAVEAGVPLATSVARGPAFVLDAYGRIVVRIGIDQVSSWKVVTVPVR